MLRAVKGLNDRRVNYSSVDEFDDGNDDYTASSMKIILMTMIMMMIMIMMRIIIMMMVMVMMMIMMARCRS